MSSAAAATKSSAKAPTSSTTSSPTKHKQKSRAVRCWYAGQIKMTYKNDPPHQPATKETGESSLDKLFVSRGGVVRSCIGDHKPKDNKKMFTVITASSLIVILSSLLISSPSDARLHDVQFDVSDAVGHFVEIKKRNAKIFSKYPAEHGRITISEACETETSQLDDNEVLIAAEEAMTDSADADQVCADGSCKVDYASYSGYYESACISEGGKIYKMDFTLSCAYGDFSLEYIIEDFPNCVGISCEDDALGETFDEAIEELEDDLQADGYYCELSTSSSGPRIMFAISTIIVSSVLFLL